MSAKVPRPIPGQSPPDPTRDYGPIDSAEISVVSPDSSADSDSDSDSDSEFGEVELQALRRIADECDAPPSIVDELAMAAFETRNLDLQLACLIADSENGSELVRSVATGPRMVSFEVGEVSVELQLGHTENGIAINGLVIGTAGVVVIQTPTESFEAAIDDAGWFSHEGVVTGALRLRLSGRNGGIVTEWITT